MGWEALTLAFKCFSLTPASARWELLRSTDRVLVYLCPRHPAQHLAQRRRPLFTHNLNALGGGGDPPEPLI